jgi:hypothetical protein
MVPEVAQEELETMAGHGGAKHNTKVRSPELICFHQIGTQETPHVAHAEQSSQLHLTKNKNTVRVLIMNKQGYGQILKGPELHRVR